jgi:hypothetical protein
MCIGHLTFSQQSSGLYSDLLSDVLFQLSLAKLPANEPLVGGAVHHADRDRLFKLYDREPEFLVSPIYNFANNSNFKFNQPIRNNLNFSLLAAVLN